MYVGTGGVLDSDVLVGALLKAVVEDDVVYETRIKMLRQRVVC